MMTSSPRTTAPDDLRAVRVAVDHHLERLGRAAPQRVHAHDVAAAHVREQRTDRHRLRRNRDIDRAALDQLRIRGFVDQRHHLVSAQAFGEHGRQDIRLLGVRQGGKNIGAVDVLLEQQFLVRRVAMQYGRALQLFRDFSRPLAVALDEFYLIPVLQFARQAYADVAAARNDHAARGRFFAAQLLHDHANILARGEEKYLVAILDDRVALRLDALAGPIDGGAPRVRRGNVLAQGTQRLTHQGTALQGTNAHQAHPAIGEIQHLQSPGISDQTCHVLGHQLFGADPDIHRNRVLAEQPVPFGEVGRAHTRNLLRRAVQGPRNMAGQHVDLVAVGQRDENIGGGDTRGLQDARARRIAVHRANVESILQIAQDLLVQVDDGHVIRFLAGEVIRRRAADLSCAQYDDFHSRITLHERDWRKTASTTSYPAPQN